MTTGQALLTLAKREDNAHVNSFRRIFADSSGIEQSAITPSTLTFAALKIGEKFLFWGCESIYVKTGENAFRYAGPAVKIWRGGKYAIDHTDTSVTRVK